MSVTIKVFQHFEVSIGGELKEAGSRETAQEITAAGHVFEVRAQVDDNYLDEVLWTTGDGNIDDFDFLWFESDADVFLELRNTMSPDEFLLIEVKADIPLMLSSDNVGSYATTTRLDDAQLVEATDWDQVDQITVQNNVADEAGDATVRLVLIT